MKIEKSKLISFGVFLVIVIVAVISNLCTPKFSEEDMKINSLTTQNNILEKEISIYQEKLHKQAFYRDSLENINNKLLKEQILLDSSINVYKQNYLKIDNQFKKLTAKQLQDSMITISNVITTPQDTSLMIPKQTGVFFLESNGKRIKGELVIQEQDKLIGVQKNLLFQKDNIISSYKQDSIVNVSIISNLTIIKENHEEIITKQEKQTKKLKNKNTLLKGVIVLETVAFILILI